VLNEWRRWQGRHLDAVRRVAEYLDERKLLRSSVDAASATDTLYVLGGADTYRQLVYERGWSAERYERWLVEAVRELLLGGAAISPTGTI
jgi:hypothetical protein